MTAFSAIRSVTAAISLVVLAAGAQAQECPDWQLDGTGITTDAATVWAPQSYATTAGGPLNLVQCATVPGYGYMNRAPSFTITYDDQGRGLDLDFRVEAACDTLLLINDATAEWHFNDDDDNSLNPRIRLSAARSGVYDVWVGTYETATCAATFVLETFPAAAAEPAPEPEPEPAAAICPAPGSGGAALSVAAGGEERRDVVAGGSIDLFQRASACGIQGHGHVAPAPDFAVTHDAGAGGGALRFAVAGECDTLLLVSGPDGAWLFNDDHDGLDPMVEVAGAASGRYDVWVGTYGSNLCRAALTVTAEAAPAAAVTCPDPALDGAAVSLAQGATEERPVVAGGAINLFNQASACAVDAHGYVAPAPDFALTYAPTQGDTELVLAATGDCDTLLLVSGPDGTWHFNDDHESLDPQITVANAAAGRYAVWIGTFGPDLCRANLTARSVVPAAPAAPALSK